MIDKHKLIQGIGAPLAETNSLPVCVVDNKLHFRYANKSLLDLFEYTEEELDGRSLQVIVGKNKIKDIFLEIVNLIKNKSISKREWVGLSKSGKEVHVIIEASRVRIDNKMHTLAVVVDNTKKAVLETSLKRSADLNQLVEKISKRGNFEYNLKTKKLHWTEGLFDIFELPPSEDPPKMDEQSGFFTKEEWDYIYKTLFSGHYNDGIVAFETKIYFPDGRYKYLHCTGKLWENTQYFHGTVRDITEEKKRNIEIEYSERKFRQLTEAIPHIVWIADLDAQPIYINNAGLTYFGKNKSDLLTWDWLSYLTEEEYAEIVELWNANRESKSDHKRMVQLKNKYGELRWFSVTVFPQYDEQLKMDTWTIIATDVHDQLSAQKEVEQSNQRLRSLIDASPIAIYSSNLDGYIQDIWNPAAERILGWQKEEVTGKKLTFLDDNNDKLYKKAIDEILKSGQINRIIKRKTKTGKEITVDATGGAIYDEFGNIEEVIVTMMDISELIDHRRQLQESLKEKNTLLQEIHHRVKNNLAIIASLLQLQVYQSHSNDEKAKLMDAQNRVKSIAMVHELLYSTEEFNKIDLSEYYERLLLSVKGNLVGLDQELNVHHQIDIALETLSINQAIPLGLLINELVTNTLKYAFPNQKEDALITLNITKEGNSAHVMYSDNGVGFDRNSTSFTSGLGLQIIDSLLTQLDANYQIDSSDGYTLTFDFPLLEV